MEKEMDEGRKRTGERNAEFLKDMKLPDLDDPTALADLIMIREAVPIPALTPSSIQKALEEFLRR